MAHKVNNFLTRLLRNIEAAQTARAQHQIKALGFMQNVD
jgi:hypothetical protein